MQGQSEQIRDLIRRNFDGITETNNHVYGTVLEHYGLTMRPPFTLDQLTVVLTGLVQGLAIRSAVDPAAVPLELPDTAPTDITGSTGRRLGLLQHQRARDRRRHDHTRSPPPRRPQTP